MPNSDTPSISMMTTEGNPSGSSYTERSSGNIQDPTTGLAPTNPIDSFSRDIVAVRQQPTFDRESVHSLTQVEGISKANRRLEHRIIGPWKRWSRLHHWEKVFLVACNVALLISLVMTIYKFMNAEMSQTDSAYGLILITATLFSFYYVIMGVHQEHPLFMLALVITNAIVWGYVFINFINYKTNEQKFHTGKLVRLIFTSVFTILLLPLATYFAWWYYSRQTLITFVVDSVNKEIRGMASMHFTFTSGIMFDLQLQVNFLILVLRDGVQRAAVYEWTVLIVGVVLTSCWSFLGRIAVRKENNILLLCFVILTFPNLIYAAFKFYQLWKIDTSGQIFDLTLLSGLSAVVIRIGVLVLTYFVYQDFGKGLKESIYRYDSTSPKSRRRRPTVATTSGEDPDTPDVRVHRLTFTKQDDSL